MRELLVVLIAIAALLALTAFRYRKQIYAVYRFWSAIRDVQRKNAPEQVVGSAGEIGPLVNCAKCGSWTPEANAIRLGTRTFYCSAACMEKAATAV